MIDLAIGTDGRVEIRRRKRRAISIKCERMGNWNQEKRWLPLVVRQFRISWLNVSLIEWRWFAWTSSFIKSDKVKSAISHKNKAYFLLLLHNDSPSSSHNTLNNALSIGKLFLRLSTRRTLTYSSWLSNYTMIMNALIISVMMQIRQLEGILVCCAPSGSCWLLLRTLEARGSKLEDKTRQDKTIGQ